jgi:hypothetical protein
MRWSSTLRLSRASAERAPAGGPLVSSTTPAAGLLRLDAGTFAAGFNRRPFGLRHRLAGHPLFRLPRLLELARSLPERQVEYNPGNVPITLDPTRTPRSGLSVEETIRRIEECGSWMALRNVEADPEYRALLDRCLDEVQVHSERLAPGMRAREGYIFLSSPRAVTPYHMDPEYNFLLQVCGTKTVYVFDGADREVLSEQELESFLSGGHRNLVLDDAQRGKAAVFELGPGDGLHLPVTFPHYVVNGDAVSLSLSITFQTPASERRAALYKVNAWLRRSGVTPKPVGRSPVSDSVKHRGYQTARLLAGQLKRLRRLLGPRKRLARADAAGGA